MSGGVGKFGASENINIMKPTITSVLDLSVNCLTRLVAKFSSSPRVVLVATIPVAVATINAGIWLTSPSPIVRIVKVAAASVIVISF